MCVGLCTKATHGCGPVTRTDLHVNAQGVVGSAEVREAVRCIRLRLYSLDEAAWAVTSGHINIPWESAEEGPRTGEQQAGTSSAATCTDLPGNSGGVWLDKDGDGCQEWGANGWCRTSGSDVFVEGVPNDKCCACGGGSRTVDHAAMRQSVLAKDLRVVANTGQMCEVRQHLGVGLGWVDARLNLHRVEVYCMCRVACLDCDVLASCWACVVLPSVLGCPPEQQRGNG